jgi:ABC-type transport system involved in multi-copper enzyme maturation permease subunit
MFAELVLKELRDHLLSLRFQIGLLLALVLVSASAFVLSAQYRRELREFFQRQQQADDFLSQYSHLNRVEGVLQPSKPPSPVVLVQGLPDPANAQTLDSNPMPDLFRPVDLTTAVAFIFSLLGIVLGFDAVNGEKERGTLRLVLANGLRRFTVLSAKWAGGMLVMVVALLAAWLAATTVVLVQSGTHWAADDALSLITLWVFSLLYCGAFFTLALAFSTLSSRSSVSVLASLFTWVLLVFVLPNISPYAAAQIVRVPSLAALQRDLQYITSEERDNLGREGTSKVYEQFGCVGVSVRLAECTGQPGAGPTSGKRKFSLELADSDKPSDEIKRRIATDPEFRQFYEQLSKAVEQVWTDVNRKQEAKADRLRGAWQARADTQFNLAKQLSYTSPLPPFVYASTDLALTGLMSRRWFDQQAGPYYEALEKYLWARFHAEQAKNPAFSINDFLDVRTRPRFTFVPPPFTDRLAETLPFAALLGGWNLAFFTLAVFAFLRFDVR